jgi:hypothetical protein
MGADGKLRVLGTAQLRKASHGETGPQAEAVGGKKALGDNWVSSRLP